MHNQPLSSRDFDNPSQQDLEILAARKEYERDVTLHDFKVLVDELGVPEVIRRMDGDAFWKLYTYFRNTANDGDK